VEGNGEELNVLSRQRGGGDGFHTRVASRNWVLGVSVTRNWIARIKKSYGSPMRCLD
jgi:hypothetical protein